MKNESYNPATERLAKAVAATYRKGWLTWRRLWRQVGPWEALEWTYFFLRLRSNEHTLLLARGTHPRQLLWHMGRYAEIDRLLRLFLRQACRKTDFATIIEHYHGRSDAAINIGIRNTLTNEAVLRALLWQILRTQELVCRWWWPLVPFPWKLMLMGRKEFASELTKRLAAQVNSLMSPEQ